MRRIRHLAAVGAVVSLLSLCAAPAAAAAPRTESSFASPLLVLQGFVGQVVDLFGGWIEAVFAAGGVAGDPNG